MPASGPRRTPLSLANPPTGTRASSRFDTDSRFTKALKKLDAHERTRVVASLATFKDQWCDEAGVSIEAPRRGYDLKQLQGPGAKTYGVMQMDVLRNYRVALIAFQEVAEPDDPPSWRVLLIDVYRRTSTSKDDVQSAILRARTVIEGEIE